MRLIGTEPRRIVEEVRRLLDRPAERAAMMIPAFPYGDGTASRRIAAIIEQWLVSRMLRPSFTFVSDSQEPPAHSGLP